jgi:hypothetical protein
MPWGISDEDVRRAMLGIFGDDGSSLEWGDGGPADVSAPGPASPSPPDAGITKGILASSGVIPASSQGDAARSDTGFAPASFNLYDNLHRILNTQAGNQILNVAEGLARGAEEHANHAAAVGATGALVGAATADPFVAGAGLGLLGLAGTMGLAGKVGDLGTSFLRSVQHDDSQPLRQSVPRMFPDFTDLKDIKPR